MDCKESLRIGLDEYLGGLRKALDGLTDTERRFQPNAAANHIDFIVWHMARDEDGEVSTFAQQAPEIWILDAWHEKLGLPAGDDGFDYTVEQVANLLRFDIAYCMAYYEAVRGTTLRFLDGLTPADLDRCPQPERRPGHSIGRMLTHLIVEGSQHLGQAAYLRGLQRGVEYSTSWVSQHQLRPSSRS